MEDAAELRRLAEWYRAFAEVGHPKERAWRLKFADALDEMVDRLERQAERVNDRPPPSPCMDS